MYSYYGNKWAAQKLQKQMIFSINKEKIISVKRNEALNSCKLNYPKHLTNEFKKRPIKLVLDKIISKYLFS